MYATRVICIETIADIRTEKTIPRVLKLLSIIITATKN